MLSDHKPLTFALHCQSDSWSARQQRHLSYLARYTSDIRHVAGKENVVADCLSRPPEELSLPRSTHVVSVKPAGSLATPVARDESPGASTVAVVSPGLVLDMAELACAQEGCQETHKLRAKLTAQDMLIHGHKIWCDEAAGTGQLKTPGLQQCAQSGSPRHTCHQAHADQQICVDQLLI